MNSTLKLDIRFIKRCLTLAKKGLGKVSPNPLVGSILVKRGKVIGEGWHKKYGGPHSEVNAIKNAIEDVIDSTLYCNLEPCCHSKKQTPPCVPLIIKKKIKRIVISNYDPNDEVNGKAIKKLKKVGIEVTTGILESEGKELNRVYFKFIQKKIPYVTLKIALSTDGKISISKNKQTWLTGKESVKFVHKLRSEYDAVLVGANTIKTDNPLLNVRETKGRNPIRIIIDGKLSIPLKSRVIESKVSENTWIFTSDSSSIRKANMLTKKGVKIFRLKPLKQDKLDIKKILKIIADNKITSILVEGGEDIFSQFIRTELFDEIIILQSPKVLNKGIEIRNIGIIKRLKLMSAEKLGDDIKSVYRRN